MGSSCLDFSSCWSPALIQKIMSILDAFCWVINSILYLQFTSQVLVRPPPPPSPPPPPRSHQRSPCVRVSHLCFGCCADGSLLVLHNGSKVTVAHAINTHSNFSAPAVSFVILLNDPPPLVVLGMAVHAQCCTRALN